LGVVPLKWARQELLLSNDLLNSASKITSVSAFTVYCLPEMKRNKSTCLRTNRQILVFSFGHNRKMNANFRKLEVFISVINQLDAQIFVLQ